MKPFALLALITGISVAAPAMAVEEYTLTLKDHKFTPQKLTIPADTKVKLIVKNEDATPAEFESDDFKREKIIKGNSQATIFVGPLKAGSYAFFDEFNEDSATGTLIVK